MPALSMILRMPWLCAALASTSGAASERPPFPRPLSSYPEVPGRTLWGVLRDRAVLEPINVVATTIFALAILHTFFANRIQRLAYAVEERHRHQARSAGELSFLGVTLHFLGEVEAIFGIWAVVLAGALVWSKGHDVAVHYLAETVSYVEPMFVVVVMAIAGTRPVLELAEGCLRLIAGVAGASPAAWWTAILIVAPLLGSLITEPAAMTIAAVLLGRQFYELGPSRRLKYATLGLLFVNVSVGGTLTHFAAPPVLMVAAPWGWHVGFMLSHFGWKAVIGIALATAWYLVLFRRELQALGERQTSPPARPSRPVPLGIVLVHLAFLAFTVAMAHHPPLFIGGFLFFLAFAQATAHHQSPIQLRAPMLVGFFLAGLVVHGGLQAWWIGPVLRNLSAVPLFIGATVLTAFNDNAAITYLATLVPGFTEPLKYAVVAGAVTGGGLTVIANAPNPAGQSILARHFEGGIAPLSLFRGALVPTLILALVFLLL